jgi:Lon protease-like protein
MELPLFPLNTVLFPGMLLPLRIFEERYKLMIGRCIDEKAPFGVVLIQSGDEVGGPAEPYMFGTTARISRVQRLDEGRLNVIAFGEQRFRIKGLDYSEAHLVGDVEYVESEGGDTAEAAEEAHRIGALLGEAVRLAGALRGEWRRELTLPPEPDRLADFVAAQLEAAPEEKQRLLETLPVVERLRAEFELLGERIRALTEQWEERRRDRFAGAALN